MTETIINIEGMSCQHCVMRVKKAIEGLKGVHRTDVEIGRAKVTFDEAVTGEKTIEEAIVKAGYRIKG